MKRLAIAAAIVLAASTVGVGPALAESEQSATAVEAGAHPPTSGGDEDGNARDGDTGDEPGPGDGQADDPADSQDPSDPGEPTEEPTDESEPIDASFSVDKTEMTAEEIGNGIGYTIDSLQAGDVVTTDPRQSVTTTVERDGTFNGTIAENTDLKTGDTLTVTVTVARAGQASKTFTGQVDVVAGDGNANVELSVSPETQAVESFLQDGVHITLADCATDEEVHFALSTEDDPDNPIWEDTQDAAGEDAAGSTTFVPDGGDGAEWTGTYAVTASCGDRTAEASFTVTDGEEGDEKADLTVSPRFQKLSDFFDSGVNFTFDSCHSDDEVDFRVSTKQDSDTTVWKDSQVAGEDAAGHTTFVPDGSAGAGWVGDYLVTASCGAESAEAAFTVTEDDSVIDPKLAIAPETISGIDFVNRDKGVRLTVTECRSGSDVQFEVWGHEPREKLYEQVAEADGNGKASVQVYGLEDLPGAYVGTYSVVATCMEQKLEGEFNVAGSDGSGGSDDSDDSRNAGSMPRTGAEITGLGAGALLVLGGAASIVFARRRTQSDR